MHSNDIRSEALPSKRAAPRIGFLMPGHIERAFIVLVYLAMTALVVLSVFGTFYGQLGKEAPLSAVARVFDDIAAYPLAFVVAFGTQAALSLTQYGARQLARHDRRWWLLYLAALAISVYYNVVAYWSPLDALGVAWYFRTAIILAGDIVPEIAAVRRS